MSAGLSVDRVHSVGTAEVAEDPGITCCGREVQIERLYPEDVPDKRTRRHVDCLLCIGAMPRP